MNRNRSGRRYDREFKNNAVALVRGGRTITEVARDLGVSKWSLGHWVRRAEEGQMLSEPKTLVLARIFHRPLGKSGTEPAKKRGPSELHSASWGLATNSLSWRLVQAWGDWFTRLRARGADTLLRTKRSSPRSSSSQVTSSPALSPIAAARGSGK